MSFTLNYKLMKNQLYIDNVESFFLSCNNSQINLSLEMATGSQSQYMD